MRVKVLSAILVRFFLSFLLFLSIFSGSFRSAACRVPPSLAGAMQLITTELQGDRRRGDPARILGPHTVICAFILPLIFLPPLFLPCSHSLSVTAWL